MLASDKTDLLISIQQFHFCRWTHLLCKEWKFLLLLFPVVRKGKQLHLKYGTGSNAHLLRHFTCSQAHTKRHFVLKFTMFDSVQKMWSRLVNIFEFSDRISNSFLSFCSVWADCYQQPTADNASLRHSLNINGLPKRMHPLSVTHTHTHAHTNSLSHYLTPSFSLSYYLTLSFSNRAATSKYRPLTLHWKSTAHGESNRTCFKLQLFRKIHLLISNYF